MDSVSWAVNSLPWNVVMAVCDCCKHGCMIKLLLLLLHFKHQNLKLACCQAGGRLSICCSRALYLVFCATRLFISWSHYCWYELFVVVVLLLLLHERTMRRQCMFSCANTSSLTKLYRGKKISINTRESEQGSLIRSCLDEELEQGSLIRSY